MNHQMNKEKEAFEAWFKSVYPDQGKYLVEPSASSSPDLHVYASSTVQMQWEAWTARSLEAANLKEQIEELERVSNERKEAFVSVLTWVNKEVEEVVKTFQKLSGENINASNESLESDFESMDRKHCSPACSYKEEF